MTELPYLVVDKFTLPPLLAIVKMQPETDRVTTPARNYHHGNLRATLLAAAAEEVHAVGAAQLSLRHLARRAGVSHAAPAYHFRDKRGLFTALAAEGFRMLHERTRPALGHDGALLETGRRYVEFALDNPAHFTAMFDTSLLDTEDEDFQRERTVAFEVLYEAIRLATNVADAAELEAQTLAAWLAVHGIATLWLSGNLPYDRDSRLVGDVVAGLAPALARIADVSAQQAAMARD
jgi:AcrR family transcriptional regulator